MRVTSLWIASLLLSPVADAQSRPNVVLVITDDQGYGDLGCHGNDVLKTPQLDRLAAESVRLVDYHVAPTCSPTRCALQTGRWTNRTGVWHTINGRSLLRDDEVTMGEVFSAAGYRTAMYGKWHLGDNAPCRPQDCGYQEVFCHGGGGVGQTPDYWDNAYFDGHYFHNGEPEAVKGFCTDVFFNEASKFIQRDDDRPFFIYLATNAAHGPMHAPEEFSKPYESLGTALANFYGMVANIDWNVGRMRSMLEAKGLAENTIFIFTTDNGTAGRGFNANMRGRKGSEYDGGHRVPMFMHWPKGGISGGRDLDLLTAHVDMMPTLCELCGVDLPDRPLDGTSLAACLTDGVPGDWPDRLLITDSQRVIHPKKWRKSAVMSDRWRLINGAELYDMNADPSQKTDVAKGHPDVVKRMRAFYESWWSELEPTFKNDVRLHLGDPREKIAVLTSHDWITPNGGAPWNQAQIRRGVDKPNIQGFWHVDVRRAGRYAFTLRRWPSESGGSLSAGLEPGADVPGVKAMRTAKGRAFPITGAWLEIAGQRAEQKVEPDAASVRFELDLDAGPTKLTTRLVLDDGKEIGAYYCEVEHLGKREMWSRFRGPNGTGVAECSDLPTTFGPAQNVAWKLDVPLGHSSPVLNDTQLFLTGERDGELLTLCIDRLSGEVRWSANAPRTRSTKIDKRNNSASPTPALDDDVLIVFFPDFGMLGYSLDGRELWRMELGPFDNLYGMGASPILHGSHVYLACDQQTNSFVLAADKRTGEIAWRVERPYAKSGHCTPVIHRAEDGSHQLVLPGSFYLDAYDTLSGERVWWVAGLSFEMKSVPVLQDGVIYINGYGSPLNQPGQQVKLDEFAAVVKERDTDGDGLIHRKEMPRTRGAMFFDSADLNVDQKLNADEWKFLADALASQNGMLAIRAGGRGDMTDENVLWAYRRSVPQLPSPLIYDDVLYMLNDQGGILVTFAPDSGEVKKRGRVDEAIDAYYAAPVAGDGKVYLVSEQGLVTVLPAGGSFEPLAVNDLDEPCYATPALAENRIYLRTTGTLYCFAKS